jgi:hypothetical protein
MRVVWILLAVVACGGDRDGDGFEVPEDCDDRAANVNPDANEIVGNGIDEDCDGEDLTAGAFEGTWYSDAPSIDGEPATLQMTIGPTLLVTVESTLLWEEEAAPFQFTGSGTGAFTDGGQRLQMELDGTNVDPVSGPLSAWLNGFCEVEGEGLGCRLDLGDVDSDLGTYASVLARVSTP